MSVNIWGINPKTKKAEIFALAMPAEAVEEKFREAVAAGWTNVQTNTATFGMEEDPTIQHRSPEVDEGVGR